MNKFWSLSHRGSFRTSEEIFYFKMVKEKTRKSLKFYLKYNSEQEIKIRCIKQIYTY